MSSDPKKCVSLALDETLPHCKLLMVGISAKTHLIGDLVRKTCRVDEDADITAQNLEACRTEAEVYMILGGHPLIANCTFIGPNKDYIEFEYYPNGNMKEYLADNRTSVTSEDLSGWEIQMISSVNYIHSKGVIHSDLRMDQWFLDRNRGLGLVISMVLGIAHKFISVWLEGNHKDWKARAISYRGILRRLLRSERTCLLWGRVFMNLRLGGDHTRIWSMSLSRCCSDARNFRYWMVLFLKVL